MIQRPYDSLIDSFYSTSTHEFLQLYLLYIAHRARPPHQPPRICQPAISNIQVLENLLIIIKLAPFTSAMSGIPIYTQSPINASKASGVIAQTAVPQAQPPPRNTAPATTATSISPSSYPSAQPGAISYPGPTAAPQVVHVSPLQPTPTTRVENEGPPPPQPGNVPTPLNRKNIPPSPKSGETYRPQETGAPAVAPPPAGQQPYQMGIPLPTHGAQPPRSSTSTTTTASTSYPVAVPSEPRRSLEHPLGYQQNVYASEQTSNQRRAQEANMSGIGALDTSENVGDMDLLNTAKKWAQQAGEKISEAEAEVWRRINKE